MFSLPVFFAAVGAGFILGVISGLTPGLHVNNFALILLGLSPILLDKGVPAPYVAAIIVANAVTHTFLDIVPSVYLGAPDGDMALSVLPGHRLLMEGRGREAIRLSALGSAASVVAAVVLLVPMIFLFMTVYPFLEKLMALVLILIAVLMVVSERGDPLDHLGRPRAWASASLVFLLSGVLGIVSLGEGEWSLFPLFSGLFGAPILILSLAGRATIPPQLPADLSLHPRGLYRGVTVGSLAGCLVAWLPGVSSGVATVLARLGLPGGDEEYLVSLSSVNTSNAIYCLVALAAIGRARSGAMAALGSIVEVTWDYLPLFLAAIILAALPAYLSTIYIGDRAARYVSRLNYPLLCLVILLGLIIMVVALTGALGIIVFLCALPLGLLPPLMGVRRTHLMGVLLLPLIIYFL